MGKKKLLDQVSDIIRLKDYSIRTEETDLNWIKRYILSHKKRHPAEMGEDEISAFLTHLAAKDWPSYHYFRFSFPEAITNHNI